jgi:hypothetical protein
MALIVGVRASTFWRWWQQLQPRPQSYAETTVEAEVGARGILRDKYGNQMPNHNKVKSVYNSDHNDDISDGIVPSAETLEPDVRQK